jgi:hypothetical protein
MGSQNLDLLVHPEFRSKSEELVCLLNKDGAGKDNIDEIKILAKCWLELYHKAKKFVLEPPFLYCNMYLITMRRSYERGKIKEELLIDAYNLWVTAFDSFQKGYKSDDT